MVARAHLRVPERPSPPVAAYPPAADLADRVRFTWVPVWDIPPGQVWEQQVLQYPSCQLVVAHDYDRCYGVVRGLSRVTLAGRGWVFGTALAPGAGWLVAGRAVQRLTDTWVPLGELGPAWGALVPAVRSVMAADPADPAAHGRAAELVAETIREQVTLDEEGRLVDRIVEAVESDPLLLRVGDLAERFAMSERTLQRLCLRRLGLTPRWLVQRRRLHEGAARLRAGHGDLASLAADLGYADQAHFSREFREVTGQTPSGFRDRTAGQPDQVGQP